MTPRLPAAQSSHSPLSPAAIILLISLFLLRGIQLACILPPFEGWDEYQHLGYIDRLASGGSVPVFGQTFIDPQFMRAIARFPQPKDRIPAEYSPTTYSNFWTSVSAESSATTPVALYQAQHPSTYYRLMVPIYRIAGGRRNLSLAVSVLRLVNLLFGAAALLLILLWIRAFLDSSIAIPAALWISFQPLLLLNVDRVANDALACFLGTAVITAALSAKPNLLPRLLILAILLPLAALTKMTNLVLLPWGLGMIIFSTRFNPLSMFRRLLAASFLLIVFLLATAPYFLFNLHHFGLPTPMQEAVINHQANRHLFQILRAPKPWLWFLWTWEWWIGNSLWIGGWSFLKPPLLLRLLYQLLLAISALALLPTLLRKSRLPIIALLICMQLAMLYHAAESFSAFNGKVTTNPWYAAVAVPWFLILLATGASNLPASRARTALLYTFPALCFITEVIGLLAKMLPFYSGTGNVPLALRRLAQLHPSFLQFPTLLASTLCILALLIAITVIAIRSHKISTARG